MYECGKTMKKSKEITQNSRQLPLGVGEPFGEQHIRVFKGNDNIFLKLGNRYANIYFTLFLQTCEYVIYTVLLHRYIFFIFKCLNYTTRDSYFGKKKISQLVFILISTEISGRRNTFLGRRKEAEIYQYYNCSQNSIITVLITKN